MRRRWLWLGLGVAALALAARRRPFRVLVEGDSMEPTLRPGDQLLAVRRARIRRGDLVVVHPPAHDVEMVKRVASLPGDILTVDGGEHRLGPDQYLVLGDNPDRSTDGRTFGPVRQNQIVGVVRFRYRPSPRLLSG